MRTSRSFRALACLNSSVAVTAESSAGVSNLTLTFVSTSLSFESAAAGSTTGCGFGSSVGFAARTSRQVLISVCGKAVRSRTSERLAAIYLADAALYPGQVLVH